MAALRDFAVLRESLFQSAKILQVGRKGEGAFWDSDGEAAVRRFDNCLTIWYNYLQAESLRPPENAPHARSAGLDRKGAA
jgi:hypothetical protein